MCGSFQTLGKMISANGGRFLQKNSTATAGATIAAKAANTLGGASSKPAQGQTAMGGAWLAPPETQRKKTLLGQ